MGCKFCLKDAEHLLSPRNNFQTTQEVSNILQLWETICLDVAVETGLMKALVARETPLAANELSQVCSVEPLLMSRILRCLGSYGAVKTISSGGHSLYAANRVSRLYASERGELHTKWIFRTLVPGLIRVPEKLKGNNFRSLTSGTDTVYSDLHGREGTLWSFLTPEEIRVFNGFMPAYNIEHRDWLDVYPAQERLIEGANADAQSVLFVDVGGNTGSQAAAFRRQFPGARGRVIVQDLPQALQSPEPGIEVMPQDFFMPQAIHGARAYYLRYIMHVSPCYAM